MQDRKAEPETFSEFTVTEVTERQANLVRMAVAEALKKVSPVSGLQLEVLEGPKVNRIRGSYSLLVEARPLAHDIEATRRKDFEMLCGGVGLKRTDYHRTFRDRPVGGHFYKVIGVKGDNIVAERVGTGKLYRFGSRYGNFVPLWADEPAKEEREG